MPQYQVTRESRPQPGRRWADPTPPPSDEDSQDDQEDPDGFDGVVYDETLDGPPDPHFPEGWTQVGFLDGEPGTGVFIAPVEPEATAPLDVTFAPWNGPPLRPGRVFDLPDWMVSKRPPHG